ncbi:MAG: T9SS type A sorting domain-containing protein [Bacteroidota bacterium]|nr:T9SS type A sorting domain-containing protein [Bacteroidota bacterium]MDP3144903.1 T9SS type A sorting domain-containing protein [Bacteroidota bacterium]MDP3557084.1 T9SS type A sorting domain-containing protein [Bacteroidota bacterium]
MKTNIKKLFLTCGLTLSIVLTAQNQLKGWHIGNNLLDLRTTTPVLNAPYSTSTPHNNIGINSMYDSEGKLLFYIANNNVYNKFGAFITVLAPGPLGISISYVIAPSSDNSPCIANYFVFYLEGKCCGSPDELRYKIIDMQANNGNGSAGPSVLVDQLIAGIQNLALSKKVGNTRFLYTAFGSGIRKYDVTNSVSVGTTIFTSNSNDKTETGELEISDAGDKLAWTEGTFLGGAVGNDVNMLFLNPSTGLPISTTLYSFNSGYNTSGANQFKGLEFDKTGNFLYVANRNTGVIYKDLTQPSTSPVTLIGSSSAYTNSMLEKSYNGNEIICASTTAIRSINTTSNLFTSLLSVSNALPNGSSFNFILMPDQIDGENYDLNPNINIDVNNYTASTGGTWLPTSNPFFGLQQNSYLGSLTSFPLVRFGGDLTITSPVVLDIRGMEFQQHTNTTIKMNGGSNLSVSGSYLHAHPCGLMWNGIVVNDNNSASSTFLTLQRIAGKGQPATRLSDAIKGIFSNKNNSIIKVITNTNMYDNEKSVVIINGNTSNEFSSSSFQQLNPLRDQAYGSNNGYSSKYGITGIEIQNTTLQNIALISGSPNTFYGGQLGVDCISSSANSYFNTYQNIKGTGIRSNANFSIQNINVQSNYFYANYRDIDCYFGNNLTVQKSTLNNCLANSINWNYNWGKKLLVGGDNTSGSNAGNIADANSFNGCNWNTVYCLDNEDINTNIQINYNTMQNASWAGGIYLNQTNLTSAYQTFGKFSIANNSINQLAMPITLQNIKGNIDPTQGTPYYNALNPLLSSDLTNNFANIEFNTINYSSNINAGATGIRNYNSPQTKIKTNTVNSSNSADWQNIGIDVSDSPMMFVWSNNISAGRGIEQRLNMTNANVMCNTLSNCVIGIQLGWEWLRNTGDVHGIVNVYNRKNTFVGGLQPGYDMECYYSSPSLNQWVTPNTNQITYTGVTGNIIADANATPNNYVCGTSSRMAGGNNGNEQNETENMAMKMSVANATLLANYKAWHDKFTAKCNNKNLTIQSLSATDNQRLVNLVTVNEHLTAKNYSMAAVLLQNTSTGNVYENNLATVYNIIAAKKTQNFRLASSAEKTTLIDIAKLHPLEAGPAVYNARAILNADFNMDFNWGDSSAVVTLAQSNSRNINSIVANTLNSATIYPNPSSGKINLAVAHTNLTQFSVTNVLGVEVAKGEFVYSKEIDLSQLPKGSYIVNLTNTKTGEFVKKSLILNN